MNDTTGNKSTTDAASAQDPAVETTPHTAPRHRHRTGKHGKGGTMGRLLFMLALFAGIGGGGYFLWTTQQTNQHLVGGDITALKQQIDNLEGQINQLGPKNEALTAEITTLQSQQQQLGESLDKLRQEALGNSRGWEPEEIASLLQIANDRLALEGDVAASLAALEAADRRLQKLKNPALLEVRRLLAGEIAALRATNNPDISGMALSLGALIEGVERLPFGDYHTTQETAPSQTGDDTGWRGVLSNLWGTLKSLVAIKHRDPADRVLLAPEERYFLKQNLRLNLEAARIALLRHDASIYQQTLRAAQEWITLYFDSEAPVTVSTLSELARLQGINIAPKLPDISSSLNALQTYLDQQRLKGTIP